VISIVSPSIRLRYAFQPLLRILLLTSEGKTPLGKPPQTDSRSRAPQVPPVWRNDNANHLVHHRSQNDRQNPRPPATHPSPTPTPTRAAETVEVGNQYSISLESHRKPRTFVAQGMVALRSCANSTQIAHQSPHQTLSESTTETSRAASERCTDQILAFILARGGLKFLCGVPMRSRSVY